MLKQPKIAFVGAECSGKTTLAQALSAKYSGVFVPEAARDYLPTLQRDYQLLDIDNILRLQLQYEQNAAKNQPLFCDTEALVCKIWAEYKFGQASDYINQIWGLAPYHFYILCDNLDNWQADPLRETPNAAQRQQLFFLYKSYLEQYHRPFCIVSGNPEERVKQASTGLKLHLGI
jgi:nicotinamide riboside kinase